MKVIPTEELITILQSRNNKYINIETVQYLFEQYADDAYKDYGCSPFEITTVNQKRINLLGSTISQKGDEFEF